VPTSKKLIAMMPYDLIVIDETGLRWRLSFQAPGNSQEMIIKVSDVEDGDFLAPVAAPNFPSQLDPGVSMVEKKGIKKRSPIDASEGTQQARAEKVVDGKISHSRGGNKNLEPDEASFLDARLQIQRQIEESYTNVDISNGNDRPELEFSSKLDTDAVNLEEPVEQDDDDLLDNNIMNTGAESPPSNGSRKLLVVPGAIGGILGAMIGGPVGFWLYGTVTTSLISTAAGAGLGTLTGTVASKCSFRSSKKGYETVLPE